MSDRLKNLVGYQIGDCLSAGDRTLVYRGIREGDDLPVIIKTTANSFPTSRQLQALSNQYHITKDLDLPSVDRVLALENYDRTCALISEDTGGISLDRFLVENGRFSRDRTGLILFLEIAIQLADILAGLSDRRIVHKKIEPANIIINPIDNQIKLIDFSIAARSLPNAIEIEIGNVIEGTLAYISPEQTGRTSRGIDYRSDFYSLGITCYQLLTGQLPFAATESLDLVHYHLAKNAIPAVEICPEIPLVLSQIVDKLMAKNPDSRYQNALGLKYDLEVCLAKIRATGEVNTFIIATKDISDRFIIPDRMYGREPEVMAIAVAYERVSRGGRAMMLFAGASGIGKTTTIEFCRRGIIESGGYFISGKFDLLHRHIPFFAFTQAFRSAVLRILGLSTPQFQVWQDNIREIVGDCGQILIDIIPELEYIIGRQPPAPELSAAATEQRFYLTFQKFTRLLATAEHPLVIFLDDLQWADLASLNLLESLLESKYLLAIGAYRNDEITAVSPFNQIVRQIEKSGIEIEHIDIKPIEFDNILALVADTLHCDLETATPLAEAIEDRAAGNPLFAVQFLESLYRDGYISFKTSSLPGVVGGWQCDLVKIRELSFTDDILELMSSQLKHLSLAAQETIGIAACLGTQFDLHTLSEICQQSIDRTATILELALQSGWLIPGAEIYQFFAADMQSRLSTRVPEKTYQFRHDRLRQVAYDLIPDPQKPITHLKIGRLLQQQAAANNSTDKSLFEFLGHLNRAHTLIINEVDRLCLAELNLTASEKAIATVAYDLADNYVRQGMQLLPTDCWQAQYRLTLDLYTNATKIAYLQGDSKRMIATSTVILTFTEDMLDKIDVYRLQIARLTAMGKMLEAIEVGRNVLTELGVDLPIYPDEIAITTAMQKVDCLLVDREIEELIDLPVTSDRQAELTIELLADLGAPIFIGMPRLIPIIAAKMVELSVKYGNAAASAMGYINYGLALITHNRLDDSYKFGKLAVAFASKHATKFHGRVDFLFVIWILHRKEEIRKNSYRLQQAYVSSKENSSIITAGYNISSYFDFELLRGTKINDWIEEIPSYSEELRQIEQFSARSYLQIKQQVALNLISSDSQLDILVSDIYDEAVAIPHHLLDGDRTALAYVYIYKLMLAYLFGNYEAAVASITSGEQYLMSLAGMILVPVFNFYAALTYLAILPDRSPEQAEDLLDRINEYQYLLQDWARNAPMNYLHKWQIIEAEKQRVTGNKAGAIELYDLAIAGAKEYEFYNDLGLAQELAAKFYLDWGKTEIAKSYAIDAYYSYARWGAIAKSEHLVTLYPQLLDRIGNDGNIDRVSMGDRIVRSAGEDGIESIDLAALLKVSHAIAKEQQIDRSIEILLNSLMAEAGADKCVLLLRQEREIQVVAATELGMETKFIAAGDGFNELIPMTLIGTVERTIEVSIITFDRLDPQVAIDPYFRSHQPQSILCIPVLHQGESIGILYLENYLNIAAFTNSQIEILQLLTAHAAISIENSKMFASLERRVTERTIELERAKEAAELANRSKTNFFTNMSHELRTPLNAILGLSESLLMFINGQLNERQIKSVQTIESSGSHLLELINDILDLSKIEAGKLELHPSQVSIKSLCKSSAMFIKELALKKQIKFDLQIPDRLPDVIIDELRLRQVLINLLTNAVKFTPSGGSVTLKVEIPSDLTYLKIAITDTGIGISEADKSKLFKPFSQIDTSLNRHHQGTGLGLALVKQIIELHGGNISLESELDRGSCFTISLPSSCWVAEDLAAIINTKKFTTELDRPEPSGIPTAILLAEDNEANILTYSNYLTAVGYQLSVARNGYEVLSHLEHNQPDLILMDIQMPDMDGLEAIERIRADSSRCQMPIIALTAFAMSHDRERILAAGATAYLSKPVKLRQLDRTIQNYLGHNPADLN
jgi:predicted ATPase/signal transduction histidine kinase/ActR/RegA family two-component response regulator